MIGRDRLLNEKDLLAKVTLIAVVATLRGFPVTIGGPFGRGWFWETVAALLPMSSALDSLL